MPGGDRRGPNGLGPMTGRRAGYCAGNPQPGYLYPSDGVYYGGGRGMGGRGYGRGMGGRGYGRGYGRGVYPYGGGPLPIMTVATEEERVQSYEGYVSSLENQLAEAKKSLATMKKPEE
ncbi:MAG: DUF5320 domain-containing protein [Promethearchaeota archaeon]